MNYLQSLIWFSKKKILIHLTYFLRYLTSKLKKKWKSLERRRAYLPRGVRTANGLKNVSVWSSKASHRWITSFLVFFCKILLKKVDFLFYFFCLKIDVFLDADAKRRFRKYFFLDFRVLRRWLIEKTQFHPNLFFSSHGHLVFSHGISQWTLDNNDRALQKKPMDQ